MILGQKLNHGKKGGLEMKIYVLLGMDSEFLAAYSTKELALESLKSDINQLPDGSHDPCLSIEEADLDAPLCSSITIYPETLK